ncbi:MAG: 2-dehydro-3-deoxy-6-phosphogalactonate aldolase [Pseudomonadota bacterium]
MSAVELFMGRLAQCPLVAIIRGVQPHEAEAVGDALFNAGMRIIEVPLNSPQPFSSIERLAKRFGSEATIGAGTVLDPADVQRVRDSGGQLVVSPNVEDSVIAATAAAGMVSAPGFFTPTEAFRAVRAGAHVLKLFPAEGASPAVLKAQLAVLPADVPVLAVGGITAANMSDYLAAGARGFGLGSGLYAPGRSAGDVAQRAAEYVAALQLSRQSDHT